MAAGDILWVLTPLNALQPLANAATPDMITDGSTPAVKIPVLDFDPTVKEFAHWHVTVPSYYTDLGYDWSWKGATDNTSTGSLALILRTLVLTDAIVLTSDLGIEFQSGVARSMSPPAPAINKLKTTTVGTVFFDHGVAAGDRVIISVERDLSDTNTGDLQLAEVVIQEQ